MATITLTLSSASVAKVIQAVAFRTKNPGATAADAKQYIIREIKRMVLDVERCEAQGAVSVDDLEIS
jgi:hypothetical protein